MSKDEQEIQVPNKAKYESQESKIRKGQAFNLAVNDAIASKQQKNAKYVFQQFIYYHHLADLVQSTDLELIAEVIDKPDFMKALKELKESME